MWIRILPPSLTLSQHSRDPTLVVEPIRAIRAWRAARQQDGRVFLWSTVMNMSAPWPIGKWFFARTHTSPFGDDHPAPRAGCNCGVHALKYPMALVRQFGFSLYVLGEVDLAGRVLEHRGGYRAERAKVAGVYVWTRPSVYTDEVLERILRMAQGAAATYDVPLSYM